MQSIGSLLDNKGHEVHSVGPDDTVRHALEEMAKRDVGALMVTEGGKVVGILTERDYARKVILKGHSSAETPVRDIMSTKVLFARPEQSVEEGLALMYDKGIRHLPVMNGDDLVGIVSIKDLAGGCIANRDFLIDQLENYITGGQ